MMKTEREKIISLDKKDFEIQTFRSGGKGGQKQNKTSSGVRIIHKDSKAVGESREQRSQFQNKKIAFKRLVSSKDFQKWLKIEIARACGKLDKIQEIVEEQMSTQNIKCEIVENNKWIEVLPSDIQKQENL